MRILDVYPYETTSNSDVEARTQVYGRWLKALATHLRGHSSTADPTRLNLRVDYMDRVVCACWQCPQWTEAIARSLIVGFPANPEVRHEWLVLELRREGIVPVPVRPKMYRPRASFRREAIVVEESGYYEVEGIWSGRLARGVWEVITHSDGRRTLCPLAREEDAFFRQVFEAEPEPDPEPPADTLWERLKPV